MSLAADIERTKLTATFLNTLGTGSIITAAIAPTVGYIFGLQGLSGLPGFQVALSCVIWLFVGIALHLIARRVLKRLP